MAKYVDLPNLKENLTNFLNKKINPIYAKKTEIPSNVSELNNDKSYQTAEEVGKAVTDGVAKIVAGAPEDFDTLKEMSDWISSHETSAAAMNSAISDNSVAIANHTSNSDIHVTKAEKTKWNKLDSDLKDGTIIVAEATKATQDAQGNIINETYAKKTEIPQGTAVDDALSSTSVNPVQNKVVKAEFDKINSNLDTLEFGEVAGGKNLFNPKCLLNATYNEKTSTITVSSNNSKALDMVFKENTQYTFSAYVKQSSSTINIRLNIIYTDGTSNSALFTQSTSEVYLSATSKSGKTISEVKWDFGNNGTATYRNFQIEEGSIATEYEPYIPSVKMLADEVFAQNESLDQLKNDLSNLKDGTTPVAKAVADEDGNNIKSTYAKKTELNTKANIADPVFTGSFSQNREAGSSIGMQSHAEGSGTIASGMQSHAEGSGTVASGLRSHAEGASTTASKEMSHAEGYNTTASDTCSHAEGNSTTASNNGSHAEGNSTIASNFASHASGKLNAAMTKGGTFGNTTGTAFVIGNGTSATALSNAFSVQYDGTVKAKSTITASTTADYAEFFEWLDENPNNEDRVGYFVTLDGNRIKIASDNDDYILGIVSGEPFVLGNGDCDTWNGMYLHDEFRRTIYEPAPKVEEVEIKEEREETYIDEKTGEEKIRTVEVVVGHEFKEVEGEFDGTRPKLNPEYDNTQQYVSRFDRKEWSPVGMLGVLAVRHDGTAKVNGYVTVNKDGIATACDRNTENSYRVIKANTDSVVEIIFK